jgi:hypothetical protein
VIRIRDEFFPDHGSRRHVFLVRFFLIIVRILVLLFFLLIRLAPKTIRSKKKVGFIFHPSFYYSRIRDENCWDPDPGFGVKNLGIRIRDPG